MSVENKEGNKANGKKQLIQDSRQIQRGRKRKMEERGRKRKKKERGRKREGERERRKSE